MILEIVNFFSLKKKEYILLVISTHFFELLAKFGHSILGSLDFDGHSVKRPLKMVP